MAFQLRHFHSICEDASIQEASNVRIMNVEKSALMFCRWTVLVRYSLEFDSEIARTFSSPRAHSVSPLVPTVLFGKKPMLDICMCMCQLSLRGS